MADETTNENVKTEQVAPDAPAGESAVPTPEILPATGPSNVVEETDVHEADVQVTQGQVDALVVKPREPDNDKVNVHETSVSLDERVYDRAIVPPEGYGSLDLPIHGLASERPEDFFAREASKADGE